MKKLLLVLFAVAFASSQAACQGGRQQNTPSAEPESGVTIPAGNGGKILKTSIRNSAL